MNWHAKAQRLQAQNPHWSWSKVCAELARRRSTPPAKPSPQQFAKKLEQLKLF